MLNFSGNSNGVIVLRVFSVTGRNIVQNEDGPLKPDTIDPMLRNKENEEQNF